MSERGTRDEREKNKMNACRQSIVDVPSTDHLMIAKEAISIQMQELELPSLYLGE